MHPISALLVSFLLLFGPIADGWLGVYLDGDRDEAVVTEVIPGSPAAKAGVKAGDVILAVGDQATPTREKLIEVVGAAASGDRVSLKVQRDGRELVLAAKLGTRPETTVASPVEPGAPSKASKESKSLPSAPMQEQAPTPGALGAYLGVALVDDDRGVRIERVVPGSPAAAAGVRAGEYMQTFADQPVTTQDDVHRLIGKHKPGNQVAIGLKNQDEVRSVLVTLGRRTEVGDVAVAQPALPEPVAREPVAKSQPMTARRNAKKVAADQAGLEAELDSLRQELRDLRKQLEELRKQNGRE